MKRALMALAVSAFAASVAAAAPQVDESQLVTLGFKVLVATPGTSPT